MLTLTNSILFEDITVYRDDVNPARFYVLPPKPDIARRPDGDPYFMMMLYRHDEQRLDPTKLKDDVGGGIMAFTVQLAVPADKMNQIRNRLRTLAFGDDASDPANDVSVDYVTFTEGTVSISVAAEQPTDAGNEFVRSAVGAGKVSGVGPNLKAISVKLTQAGAAMMGQIDKLKTLPINVNYQLTYEHRLVGVTMTVFCNMQSAYTLVQDVLLNQMHETSDDDTMYGGKHYVGRDVVNSVTETLTRTKTMGVSVVPETSAVDNETLQSLEKFGLDLLNKEVEKAVEAAPVKDSGLDRNTLQSYMSSVSNNFNFRLDRTMVLTRTYVPSANLSGIFQGADIKDLVAYVDLRQAFFAYLQVPMRVNADFARLPLDSVVVTLRYEHPRTGGGGREVTTDSLSFTDGSTVKTFLAYADTLDEVAYDWTATVHYKGSPETFTLSKTGEKQTFLTIDVGQLGMIDADIGLGLADLDKFPEAVITVRYHSDALNRTLEQSFQLNKDHQSVFWTEVIHEEPTAGYEYKVDWRKKDGRFLPGEWKRTTSSRLRLDAPIPDQLSVSVLATGNFKDEISQVAVSLRYRDPDHDYAVEGALSFTDDKQVQMWIADLRNAQLRDYEYRYDIVYKDGLVKSFPGESQWFPGQPGFVVVGEHYGLEVQVFPYLLSYPDSAKVVQVNLSYDDEAHHVHDDQSFVFNKDSSKPATWRVRTPEGGTRAYTVEILYFSATGDITRSGPRSSEAEAIVVPPLPPPAPAPAPH